MTREEAIEYWEGLRKTFFSQLEKEENHFGRMHLQTTIDVLDTTISALRARQEQESKPLNEWISVKDKLPEKDGNYLVTACDEGCSAGEGIWYSTVVVVAEYYKGSWTWYDGGREYSLEGIVTHWMPMPNPPKGE